MIYYIILILIVFFTFLGSDFSTTAPKSGNIVIACFMVIIIVLFAGLRDGVWTDWEPYRYTFYNLKILDNDNEAGFVLWNKIIRSLGFDYNEYLIISYSILLAVFLYTSYSVSHVFYLFSIVFLYTIYLLPSGGFRLFIAENLVLLSFSKLIRKRYFQYFFFILLAGFFHRTAWICFPVFLLQKMNVNFKYLVVLIIVGLILKELNVFQFASDRMIENITSESLGSVTYRLNYYSDYDESSIFNVTFLRRFIQCILFVYLFHLCRKRNGTDKEKIKIIRPLISIYIVGLVIAIVVPGQFSRITGYFVISECIIVPLLIELVWKGNYKINLALFFLIILVSAFIHKLFTFYPDHFIPYKSVLFN